jgi:hypothetical protein
MSTAQNAAHQFFLPVDLFVRDSVDSTQFFKLFTHAHLSQVAYPRWEQEFKRADSLQPHS